MKLVRSSHRWANVLEFELLILVHPRDGSRTPMEGPCAVSSRRGRRSYVLTVVFGVMLPLWLLGTIDLALARHYGGAVLAFMLATLHFRVLAIVLTIRIEVDREGVYSSYLFGSRRFAWDEVTALIVKPTGFSTSNILVRTATGHYQLTVSLVNNHREMAAAIVRNAVAANPAIKVRGAVFLDA